MFTLYTFGDSILDCAHYNTHGVSPGGLLVRNDDALFPEFRGRDLSAFGPAQFVPRALDGALSLELTDQLDDLPAPEGQAVALLTIGGNDLLAALFDDDEPDIPEIAGTIREFLQALPVRPVILGNVYDPTCGDDQRNFLHSPPAAARASLARLNAMIAEVAASVPGAHLADLHAHFLTGNPSWFVRNIEPSLQGASEVRRVFLTELVNVGAWPGRSDGR